MFWTRRHLSDDVLILSMEADLPPRRLVRARRHVTGCARCQARMDHLERTLAEAVRLTGSDTPVSGAAPGDARVRLRSRMAEHIASSEATPSRGMLPVLMRPPAWLTAFAGVTVAVCIVVAVPAFRDSAAAPGGDADGVFLLPLADLTPGATRPATVHDLCATERARTARPIPASVHRAVFASYGANIERAAEYELDHLITPELGGAPDARNLWPQPFARTVWNAYVKDELEELFHQLVCDDALDLATAQREIADDWIAAYKRYFRTETPLRDYTQSPLTSLDVRFLVSELQELGVSPPPHADGPALMAMLQASQQERLRLVEPPRARLASVSMAGRATVPYE
jgi:hypothetical protein